MSQHSAVSFMEEAGRTHFDSSYRSTENQMDCIRRKERIQIFDLEIAIEQQHELIRKMKQDSGSLSSELEDARYELESLNTQHLAIRKELARTNELRDHKENLLEGLNTRANETTAFRDIVAPKEVERDIAKCDRSIAGIETKISRYLLEVQEKTNHIKQLQEDLQLTTAQLVNEEHCQSEYRHKFEEKLRFRELLQPKSKFVPLAQCLEDIKTDPTSSVMRTAELGLKENLQRVLYDNLEEMTKKVISELKAELETANKKNQKQLKEIERLQVMNKQVDREQYELCREEEMSESTEDGTDINNQVITTLKSQVATLQTKINEVENEKEIMTPLFNVGCTIRFRHKNKQRPKQFRTSKALLMVQAGDEAAHNGNALADAVLYNAHLPASNPDQKWEATFQGFYDWSTHLVWQHRNFTYLMNMISWRWDMKNWAGKFDHRGSDDSPFESRSKEQTRYILFENSYSFMMSCVLPYFEITSDEDIKNDKQLNDAYETMNDLRKQGYEADLDKRNPNWK